MKFRPAKLALVCALVTSMSCGDDDGGVTPGIDGGVAGDGAVVGDGGVGDGGAGGMPPLAEGFPTRNAYSWNGSWMPADADFPVMGLLDDEYSDGHDGTPVLPPGNWDWDDTANDLANWNNFEMSIGTFEPLVDEDSRQYGWRLVPVSDAVVLDSVSDFFEGSSGTNRVNIGSGGTITSKAGNLRDGPDILVFDGAMDAEFRTGTTTDGAARDDDLVVAGCVPNTDAMFDIVSMELHTGPGSDWVFLRDASDTGVDLGNADGATDALDMMDGNDLVVVHGNADRVRAFGGHGDDTFVLFADEAVTATAARTLYVFGGGGSGDAVFSDDGTDRLVLAIPSDTPIGSASPSGAMLSIAAADDGLMIDPATEMYPEARFCVACGVGPAGQHSAIIEYTTSVGMLVIRATGIEELQIGEGAGAKIFTLDAATAASMEMMGATPFETPAEPASLCD